MGGKNHQPCSGYLGNSTRLSRHFSLALANLEMANVDLEDVILVELGGETGSLEPMMTKLDHSLVELDNMADAARSLRTQMDAEGFQDLPSLCTVDIDAVGVSLARDKRVDLEQWSTVCDIMRHRGFYGMIDVFDERIAELKALCQCLLDQVKVLAPAAKSGDIARVLEENRVGNIRPAFAAVYSAWTDFHALFLASSLVSTELWYAWNGRGSLSVDAAAARAA